MTLTVIVSTDPFIYTHLKFGDWRSSYSNALNGTLIRSTTDFEKPVLAPVGSPAVLHDPVFLPGLMALPVPHQQHGVIGQLKGIVGVAEEGVVVDALFIVHEIWVHLQCHTHGAVLDQLQHHGLLAASPVKTTHVVILRGIPPCAFLRDFAGRIVSGVRETVLLHNAEILDVFTNQVWETSITACTEDKTLKIQNLNCRTCTIIKKKKIHFKYQILDYADCNKL